MNRMKGVIQFVLIIAAVVLTSMPKASAEDVLKIAGAQHGVWESAAPELGQQAGIFKKHGIVLDLRYHEDVKEIISDVRSGEADIGLAVGTMSAIQAYYFGAPIRIIGATMAGSPVYWYVLKSSRIQTVKDFAGKTIAYERNGSSSQYDAIDFMRKLRPRVKLVATGEPAATFERLSANEVDVGWAAPPFGVDKIQQGVIRVVARADDMSRIRNKTVGVMITNANTLQKRKDSLIRFMQAYGETIDWMYSDPVALQRFSEISDVSEGVAKRLRDEFFPKEMLLPDRIVGLNAIMKDAVVLDYIRKRLSSRQISELVQIVTPAPSGPWSIFRRLRDRLR
jgi:ABC-type nitrate/sulfonate/bicarbonate transport system substrate-binding protein